MNQNNIFFIIAAVLILVLFYIRRKADAFVNDLIMDKITVNKIDELHPAIKDKAKKMIIEAEKDGIHLRVYEALRSFERQLALYNQPFDGKDNNGNGLIDEPSEKVTNAKPGDGYHNYALAFDVVEIKDGKALWNNANWGYIGLLGEKHGLEWGGRWNFKDYPHFQVKGVALNHLKNLYSNNRFDNNGFVQLT